MANEEGAPMGSEIMKGLKRAPPAPKPKQMDKSDWIAKAHIFAARRFNAETVSVVVLAKALKAIGGSARKGASAVQLQDAIRSTIANPPEVESPEDQELPEA